MELRMPLALLPSPLRLSMGVFQVGNAIYIPRLDDHIEDAAVEDSKDTVQAGLDLQMYVDGDLKK